MKGLNSPQLAAVKAVRGRVLVLAGAGSGKTGVIVHRIAHLIGDLGVPPEAILGLTFTNKAAAEMRHRVEKLVGGASAKKVTLCTFHSFCMQVLRKEIERIGFTPSFSLYDEGDLQRVVKQLARELLGHEGELPSLASTRQQLAEVANRGGLSSSEESPRWHDAFSGELYQKLEATLRAHNAVSFDSLITLTIRLFEEHPDVLDRYQERFRYLMIDEYQDTNPAQFRLAELLAAKYQNLCVVGDDDQSIYGWRGAEVKNILAFRADQVIKLEQNYRSTPPILEAANAVIQHNKSRYEKRLWSANPSSDSIEIFNASTDQEEAESIVSRLLYLKEEKGLKWSDMAILYRSNALSRQLELALLQAPWKKGEQWVRGIPYEVFGGLEFNERSEIKDLFAYLRIIANPLDEEALLRVLNVPRRGISDTVLDSLTQENRREKIPLWHLLAQIALGDKPLPGHPKGALGIRSFVELIEQARRRFQEPPLCEALLWFLEKVDYKRAIVEEVKSEKMRQFKWENIQECVNALAQFEQDAPHGANLQDFIASTTLASAPLPSSQKKGHEERVHLMTFHSSKGLEFEACFLAGLEESILPHERSLSEKGGIEEERRLFYVGITRAKKYLTLSMARSRMRMGKVQATSPSRFLFEIPKHLLKVTNPKLIR